ncbi:MAG: flagellar export protein FliJ [Planctomycetes bacterium]|nr:flagellar export protein FliJ [Planctomycetota bacterium]
MRRFQFRLAKVQKLRAAAEKEALLALARALQGLREAEAHLEAIRTQRQAVVDDLERHLATGRIDLSFIGLHHDEIAQLDDADERAITMIATARNAFEVAREEARIRQADRKALDHLEDRAREEHGEEERREEERLMDEVAAVLHRRES